MNDQQAVLRAELAWQRRTTWLWFSIFAGPVSFAIDLVVSYALDQHACSTGSKAWLHALSGGAFVITLAGLLVSASQYRNLPAAASETGGDAASRARWMAVAGLTLCAIFLLCVAANSVPRWMLNPCD
jgi:hypothetical protein